MAGRVLDFFAGLQPSALPSGKTVANYVSNIFTKLQVVDRAQAMLRAREAGFGQL